MKSKYLVVLKLKKQKLDNIEISLLNARTNKENLQNQLNNIKEQIISQNFPKSGNFATLQEILSMHSILISHQEEIKQKIALVNNQIYQLENAHKEAFKEYEKIKFLHENEVKLMIEKINKKMQNELDELAIIRHFKRQQNAY